MKSYLKIILIVLLVFLGLSIINKKAKSGFDDIASVKVTVAETLDSNLFEVSLTKSLSGYYMGTQENLPIGIKLTFKAEAKKKDGEIIKGCFLGGGCNKTIESQISNNVSLFLYPWHYTSKYGGHPTIQIPVIVLKTEKNQIKADETATIEIIIHDDNADVSCDISHSSSKGSLSNRGGLVPLTNGEATITTILTPDAQGGYTDDIMVRVDNQEGGIAINKISITIDYAIAPEPKIEFTYVPPIGSFTNLAGIAQGVDPDAYSVVTYIKVGGGWWTKPYYASPLTSIKSDLTWICDITTGGYDSQASHIAAFLIPKTFSPPLLGGSGSLSQSLYDNCVANVLVAR